MERKNIKVLKKILVIILIAVLLTSIANIVKAANTFKATLTANTTTLKAGEEVTVTIGVSDINMGTSGINTLEGKINYDTNVFEAITSSSIQSLNNWTTTYNDENSSLNGKFLAVNLSSGTQESTQIFSVKFKVKSSVTESKETQIEFKDITSNDGTNLVNVGNKSITIKINGGTSNNTNTDNTNKDNTSGNTQEDKTNINNSSSGNSTQIKNTNDKTTAKTILPKAGKSIVIIGIIAIFVITVIALGIKNRTMRDIK